MNKYYMCLLMVGMLFLSACSSNEQTNLQTVSLKGIEKLSIDHGSTTLVVESADIESLEASWLNREGPGIVIDEEKGTINIRLKSHLKEIVNIGNMPQLLVRIPTDYEGIVSIDGSSGNTNIKNIHTKKINIKGKSGNVSLDYLEINNDIQVSVKSGNVLLKLDDKDSNIQWLLQSGSGRRTVDIPMEKRQESNRKTQGQTGDGSFNVELQTTSGSITVK